MAAQNYQSTAQEFLDVFDITNNLVILKNGTTSFILSVAAMNFGLLAEEEQDAVIYTYAALLNSLNYPIQIIIESQTKDATNYLNLLKDQEQKASSQNKQERISRYRQFVSRLIKERNVLDKKFYVAVPANALELGVLPADSLVPGKGGDIDLSKIEKSVILEKAQSVLEPKRDHLVSQFARLGLYARQLTTQEIIRVFYNNYNPEASEGQQIADTSQYTTSLVRANLMNNAPQVTSQPPNETGVTTQSDQEINSQSTQPQAQPRFEVGANMPSAQQVPSSKTTPLTQGKGGDDLNLNQSSEQLEPEPKSSEHEFKEEITGLRIGQMDNQQATIAEQPIQPAQNEPIETPLDQAQTRQEINHQAGGGNDPQSSINQTLEEIQVFNHQEKQVNNGGEDQPQGPTKDLPPIAEI